MGIRLQALGASCQTIKTQKGSSWFYSWGLYIPPFLKSCVMADIEFVPMIWGKAAAQKLDQVDWTTANALLGFNEPNHKKQANLTPWQAAYAWTSVMKLAKKHKKIRIGSPSPAPCGNPATCHEENEFVWFAKWQLWCQKRFQKECEFDFLAIHKYTCNVDELEQYVNKWAKLFPNKNIWVTEFGCPKITDEKKIATFVADAVVMLQKHPRVERYAYFTTRVIVDDFVKKPSSLMDEKLEKLTNVGKAYYQIEN